MCTSAALCSTWGSWIEGGVLAAFAALHRLEVINQEFLDERRSSKVGEYVLDGSHHFEVGVDLVVSLCLEGLLLVSGLILEVIVRNVLEYRCSLMCLDIS
jgi:hypothetical protein